MSIYVLLLQLDGYFDPFYLRFTSSTQKNLILGTSRAAQGLQPKYLNSISQYPVYNYSFTVGHSPYGPVYLRSIKKKLKNNIKHGIFIVTIDPWSISIDTSQELKYPEAERCLGKTKFVNLNPNPFYIFNNYNKPYYNLFTEDKDENVFLHRDGWLEVSIKMDKESIKQRTDHRIKNYRNYYLQNYIFSNDRYDYLLELIRFLEKRGKVFLVRLPIHPEMFKIENEFMPDFDFKITRARKLVTGYLDMTPKNSDYLYLDGNHLYKVSGRAVSKEIENWILDHHAYDHK